MTVFAKIAAYLSSSRLLFQRNFNAASDKSPHAAHYQGAMVALIVTALSAVIFVSLGRADYRAARSLLDHGVSAKGIAERVSRHMEPTVGPRKYYTTTVAYRFVGSDGRNYRGTSVTKARKPPEVASGDRIDVLQAPARPDDNAWRTALQMTITDAHAAIFAALILLPWIGLMLYRYVRWIALRWAQIPADA